MEDERLTSALQRRPDVAGFSATRVTDLLLWFLAAAVLVHVVPTATRLSMPPWKLPPTDELHAWHWTGAFLLAALSLMLCRAVRANASFWALAGAGTWPWLLAATALVVRPELVQSRAVAVGSVLLGAALLVVPVLAPRMIRVASRGAAVAALGVTVIGTRMEEAQVRTSLLNTALMPLSVTYDSGLVPRPAVPGGAIARVGAGFLLVTSTGASYALHWDSTARQLTSKRLAIPAPLNRDGAGPGERSPILRVTGLVVDSAAGIAFSAHEVWNDEEDCVRLQVSSLRITGMTALDSAWRPVYLTKPCLRPTKGFDKYESGGRLLLQHDGSILFTVGDYGINTDLSAPLAQQADVDYGKVLRITRDGSRTLFSSGHRNPQGLTADRSGRIWETEHGPRGGDELNLLQEGANYGWPLFTYGTEYGQYEWRFRMDDAARSRFREPAFVMVPSVGITSLIEVRGPLFEPWRGDLLATSLKGAELIRFRLAGDRVAYAETIPIRRRIRDLAEGANGKIVLWTDRGEVIWLEPSSGVMDGALAYQDCVACHGSEQEGTEDGPRIMKPLGRRVASSDYAYSTAMKQLGGRWTRERLDAFLRNPEGFVAGSSMRYPGMADSARRSALLDYLMK